MSEYPKPWVTVRFALLGPWLGSIVFTGFSPTIVSQPGSRSISDSAMLGQVATLASHLLTGAMMSPFAVFLAYPLGLVPAWIAGWAFSTILWCKTSRNPGILVRMILGATVGAVTSGIYGCALFSFDTSGHWHAYNAILWAASGGFSAALCASIIGDRLYRQSFGRNTPQ